MNTSNDKWNALLNADLKDIPASVERMKRKRNQLYLIFILFVVAGMVVGSLGGAGVLIGTFLAISGIVLIGAVSVMAHTQLCFYRLIIEIRKQSSG